MDTEASRTSISLVDNTAPPEPDHGAQLPRQDTSLSHTSSSRRWSRPSVRGELTKRKYAKWQPHRLGLDDGNATSGSASGLSDDELQAEGLRRSSTALSYGNGGNGSSGEGSMSPSRVVDFASDSEDIPGQPQPQPQEDQPQQQQQQQQQQPPPQAKSLSELDILYENQRGWFLFGIPLYSHSSLLNFDPSAWATRDMRNSPVNITNAQLPDPSWQWAWHNWYVDMSADVDEQGWQYSSSFSSSAWHGSHPWFHSFVRRRRWVRLRTKRLADRSHRGRSNFEEAHMFTADYFTIHSKRKRAATGASEYGSRAPSTYLKDPANQMVDEEPYLEEIGNIPTLMYALKKAIVDREKIDALKRFIEEGGDEIYYLEERIPEIMSIFVFQNSRFQFLTYLGDVINTLSQRTSTPSHDKETVDLRRKQANLTRAAESIRQHITGPELVADRPPSSATGKLDLTPVSKRDSLLSKRPLQTDRPVDNGGDIKGIPKEAEIGKEGHIYKYTS